MSIPEEHEAAKEADAIIRSLSPLTPYPTATVNKLRTAYKIATAATANKLSSAAALDETRHGLIVLTALCGKLESGSQTQKEVETAKQCVAAWLTALAAQVE